MERHGSPTFYKLLEEMAELHDRKSHDYASDENPVGNYEFAGQMACMFSHSSFDAGFVGRLAEKIYRLANLESGDKIPKNESIEDTERDIAVIVTLWMASRRMKRGTVTQVIDEKKIYTCTIGAGLCNHPQCKPPNPYSPFVCNYCQRQFVDRPPLKDGGNFFCSQEHKENYDDKDKL